MYSSEIRHLCTCTCIHDAHYPLINVNLPLLVRGRVGDLISFDAEYSLEPGELEYIWAFDVNIFSYSSIVKSSPGSSGFEQIQNISHLSWYRVGRLIGAL